MYIPQIPVSDVSGGRSAVSPSLPLDKPSSFSLDMSGVLGFFGGDDAVSTMVAVHVYGNSRWVGWYNNPGSFHISKLLGSFAKSAPLCRVFGRGSSTQFPSKSVDTDPTTLFGVESCKGPKFQAAHSGTVIEDTGYLANLFMKECVAWDSEGTVVTGRKTQPVGITIVDLGRAPPSEVRPAHSSVFTLIFAAIPIAISLATCAVCARNGDWYAASLILVGTAVSGISGVVLGSADLVFNHPEPAKGPPAGDGILSSNNDIVLLRGTEGAVNSITRGKFTLRFANEGHFYLVRCCSFLFFVQAVIQLLLVPQASLFGQVMFLVSLGVSALYSAWISSSDKGKVHQKLLFQRVLESPSLTKYTLGTRTTAVVFMLLVFKLQNPTGLLNELLPNDTKVWNQWKETILESLRHPDDQSFQFDGIVESLDGFTQQEKELLQLLYQDARAAYDGYKNYLGADLL